MGLLAIGCGDSPTIAGGAGETDSSSTGSTSPSDGSGPDENTNSNSDPTDASQTVTESVDDSGTSSDTSATTGASATDTDTVTDTASSTETESTVTLTGTSSTSDTESDSDPSGKTDSDPSASTGSGSTGASTDENTSTDGTTTDSTTTDASASGSASGNESETESETDGTTGGEGCVIAACGSHLYECGDCEDNDGDADVDGLDIECVSPCDDDESSFATGIPGDNADPCNQDCFFDGNSGAGDDGCEWNLACDPANPGGRECPYDPDESNCPPAQDQDCVDNCEVPNGCDCFGCCAVTVDGIDYEIFIGDDCELDDIENCATCTQQATCGDPCDPDDCELCFGESELPPNCEEPSCAVGQQFCIVNGDCAEGDYCQTGCCVPIPA